MHDLVLYHVSAYELDAGDIEPVLQRGDQAEINDLAEMLLDDEAMARFCGFVFDYYAVAKADDFGLGLPAVVRAAQWPPDQRVFMLITGHGLYETRLFTGKQFIDNPDWQGDPQDMVEYLYGELQGWFVLVDIHQ